MNHKVSHRLSPSAILKDLQSSHTAADVLIKLGKAIEFEIDELRRNPAKLLCINDGTISFREMCEMIQYARYGREKSYAPYSHFNVGAAVTAENKQGERRVFPGCNVENAAYGSTVCAERIAAFKAVSDGYRIFHNFAVVGGFDDSVSQKLRDATAGDFITCCGPCRQVTNEFDGNPCIEIFATDTDRVLVTTLEFILPAGFGPKTLGVAASSYNRHNKAA